MPSLQTALPPELANNAIRVISQSPYRFLSAGEEKWGHLKFYNAFVGKFVQLYRECLRRAEFVGHLQHSPELAVGMVRQQVRTDMHETDPDKIQKLKDDAARGLINHIIYEAEKMSGRKFNKP